MVVALIISGFAAPSSQPLYMPVVWVLPREKELKAVTKRHSAGGELSHL